MGKLDRKALVRCVHETLLKDDRARPEDFANLVILLRKFGGEDEILDADSIVAWHNEAKKDADREHAFLGKTASFVQWLQQEDDDDDDNSENSSSSSSDSD